MTQPISVVMPVYDGVTQLDFTGPHQFLSRTPDLQVRVASLGGRAGHGGPPHLFEPGGPWRHRVVRRAAGAGRRRLPRAIENDLFLEGDCPARSDRALPDFGLHRVAHSGRCRVSCAAAVRPATGPGGNCFRSSAPSSTRAASCATAISCPAAASRQASISCSPLSPSCAGRAWRRWSSSGSSMRRNRPSIQAGRTPRRQRCWKR